MTGTYVALNQTRTSAETLRYRLELLGVKNLAPADRYHCTIIYSKQEFPAGQIMFPSTSFTARIIRWDVFNTSQEDTDGDKCLVAILESPQLQYLHKQCLHLGGVHSFDQYNPHISVSYKHLPFNLDRLPVDILVMLDPNPVIEGLVE